MMGPSLSWFARSKLPGSFGMTARLMMLMPALTAITVPPSEATGLA